jgi:hypothetical protein
LTFDLTVEAAELRADVPSFTTFTFWRSCNDCLSAVAWAQTGDVVVGVLLDDVVVVVPLLADDLLLLPHAGQMARISTVTMSIGTVRFLSRALLLMSG